MYMDSINELNNSSDILKRLIILNRYIGKESYYITKLDKIKRYKKNTFRDSISINTNLVNIDFLITNIDGYTKENNIKQLELKLADGIEKTLIMIQETPEMFKINVVTLKLLHQTIFKKIYVNAGNFKKVNKEGEHFKENFKTVQPTFVDMYLSKIINGFTSNSGDDLLKSIVFIIDLTIISPFTIGNELMSRLIFQLLIEKCDIKINKFLPIEDELVKNLDLFNNLKEEANLGFVQKSYKTDKVIPLIIFYINSLIKTYEKIDNIIKKVENTTYDKKSEVVETIKNLGSEFTIKEIIENINIIINRQTINRILKQMQENRKIKKIGDKKHAKYIKLK